MRIGMICILTAHILWGFFPLFWRLLDSIPPATLLAHRILWSFVLLVLMGGLIPRLRRSIDFSRYAGHLKVYFAAAVLIGINWGVFLYAVSSDQVLQASLGYYINPLFNVLLGVVVLGERMERFQWIAVALAAVGVTVMAFSGSGVPWIALILATAFSLYGLVKKLAPLPALEGLAIESGLLLPLAIGLLVTRGGSANPMDHFEYALEPYTWSTWALLMTGGVITILPLTLFAIAVKRVTLTAVGIAQYIGPTIQWCVGVMILGEPFAGNRLMGFAFVWLAIVLFVAGGLMKHRHGNDS